jgi:hypothetical protein
MSAHAGADRTLELVPPLRRSDPDAQKEADTAEWQPAIEGLVLVAESGGPTMCARIGIIRALNRRVERVNPDRKDRHWGRNQSAIDRNGDLPFTCLSTPPKIALR